MPLLKLPDRDRSCGHAREHDICCLKVLCASEYPESYHGIDVHRSGARIKHAGSAVQHCKPTLVTDLSDAVTVD
jgi:hypothetical protein